MNFRFNKKFLLISAFIMIFQITLAPCMALAQEGREQPVDLVAIAKGDPKDYFRPKYKVVTASARTITAYNSEAAQCDDSPCITANGFNVCEYGVEDTIAANFLKFGTKVRIPELFGDRVFVVRDRMNRRHGERIDVWMKDRADAIEFGVQVAQIEVLEENN